MHMHLPDPAVVLEAVLVVIVIAGAGAIVATVVGMALGRLG